MNSVVSQSTEEREAEMSGLIIEFAIPMPKRATNAQEGTTPSLEDPGYKRSKPSRSDEEVQAAPTVIAVDSSKRFLEATSVVRGAAHDASRNACVTLKDEVPAEEFPLVDDASVKASLVKATDVLPPCIWRPPDKLVLSSYVEPWSGPGL